MDDTCLLASEMDLEPLIETASDAKRSNLDLGLSDELVFANVFVPDGEMNVVSDVFDVECDNLATPVWQLSCILTRPCSDSLHAHSEYAVGVHLSEDLCVVSKTCLEHVNF